MKKKLLSVLIPNYNHAKYLPECLSSVLNQAPEEVEVVVLDDASTDNSIEVIESFCKNDAKLKLVRNKINKGVNKLLNEGLNIISGEYVFGLSADDKMLPGIFSQMLPVLNKHPEIDLCTSDFAYFYNENPDQILIDRLLATEEPYCISSPAQTLDLFRKTDFWIPGHTSIMRTEWALKLGGYREELRHSSDFYLYHKIALTRPIGYVPKAMSAMRILSNSYSATGHANRKLRRQSQNNLMKLIFNDESKTLFAKSTLLRPIIKDLLLKAALTPKYWPFLIPLILKKMKKILPSYWS